jgi:predicted TIM-barrel fold metal-dependent hydrolase
MTNPIGNPARQGEDAVMFEAPVTSRHRVISSDDHVFEPPDLWTRRAERSLRERVPRIVDLGEKGQWWFYDGRKLLSVSAGAQTGVRFDDPGKLKHVEVQENVRKGGYIPQEKVKDMDADGVDAAIIYPSVCLMAHTVPDPALLTTVFRLYNDWLAEYCNAFPARLKGVCLLNVDDVGEAVAEIERCAKLGHRGALITVYPDESRPYRSPEYEPLWAAAEALEMPISLHKATNRGASYFGTGHDVSKRSDLDLDAMPFAAVTNSDHWVRMSLAHMISSGVFERHPKLQIVSVENELAWVPYFLNKMDYTYTQTSKEYRRVKFANGMLPSDVFHRNVSVSFQEDALGIRLRDRIGVDNLHWGSDYPHPESTFPKSQEILGRILEGVPESDKAKIVGGNAARIYRC